MNWTEGKLARHSRARQGKQSKQTLLRQKEHFAKARAGLLPNPSKQTSPSIALFPFAVSGDAGNSLFAATLRPSTASGDRTEHPKRRRLSSSPRNHASTSQPVSGYHFGQGSKEQHYSNPSSAGGVDNPAILEKRRKLLRENDWAGIRMQKPIPVHFEQSPPGDKRWTRRRRSTVGKTRHPVGHRHDQPRKVKDSIGHPFQNRDVRVTVGSQEVRLGEGSSVRRSRHAEIGPEGLQTFRGAAMPSTFLTSSSSLTQPSQELRTGDHRPVQRDSSFVSTSESSRSHHAKDESGGRAHLKAPKPIRYLPGLPMSLESLHREASDSIVAQVGQLVSPVPASKQEDNEAWRRFAGPSQSNAGQQGSTVGETERPMHPRISPGVSTRYPPLLSSAVSQNATSPSPDSNASSGYQRTASYDSRELDSRLGQATASACRQNASHLSSDASSGSQRMVSSGSTPSELDNISGVSGQLTRDFFLGRHSSGDSQSGRCGAAASPSSEASDLLSRYHGATSGSTDSETDSIDQRVAGLREAALKLASRSTVTPRRNERKESVDRPTRSSRYSSPDSNRSSHGQIQEAGGALAGYDPPKIAATGGELGGEGGLDLDLEEFAFGGHDVGVDQSSSPQETAAEIDHQQSLRKDSPKKDSDDIWFKYVFSDTNTEDLHKEVLNEAAKESARNLQEHADVEVLRRSPESEFGRNISTAATHGQPSVDATESGVDEDLTSASGVSASHNAAIGSSCPATQTGGTTVDGWEGCGGPPYAAPSMQGILSSGTTLSVEQDRSDSGPSGQVTSQSITDIASSFSSKAVEPPQSVSDNVGAKERFRFAPPKLFVGKLSETVPADRPVMAVKPVTLTKPRRGRPKKKARDGRANIRSIPIFHDDPIEDFDEFGAQAQAPVEPSLFGALDTE